MKSNTNDNPEFWQQGLALFGILTGWLIGPIVLALFVGKWLDQRYDSEPWLFILSIGIAFAVTGFGIIKEALKFIKQIEEDSNTIKENNKDNDDSRSDN